MRKGSANTARGARRFIDEVVVRVRRAGATGEIVLRFDSGFSSNDTIVALARLDVRSESNRPSRVNNFQTSSGTARVPWEA